MRMMNLLRIERRHVLNALQILIVGHCAVDHDVRADAPHLHAAEPFEELRQLVLDDLRRAQEHVDVHRDLRAVGLDEEQRRRAG